ncbi:response regulator [Cohnella sp. CFH 77786]|uniref:response regulator n=1 Tax=Cohnella sp. CFH 77786 TaxID=2662265 RepID=UPI001C60EC48|nr:response regulator [Cohnella sp. CFH 77786]MBW5447595.1 response regulator [Cohnella sp. CFH 77786]
MIKVIIADDESTVHEQLRLLIPWDELGWEIAGHAYNGDEARQLVEAFRPHLVITDIRMPLMDGLSFMKWLEQSGLNAKVIVLSGYGDFEYSRSAFLLGAYDYLLKPIQEAELLMALSKAVEQIRRDSRTMADRINDKAVLNQGLTLMRDEFFSRIVGDTTLEENEMIVRAEQLLLTLPDEGYAAVLVHFPDLDEHVYQRYDGDRGLFYFAVRNVMHEMLGPASVVYRNLHRTSEFVFLYPGTPRSARDLEDRLKRLRLSLGQYVKAQAMIGVSGWKQRPGKLPAAYAEAAHALETIPLSFEHPIAFYGKPISSPQPADSGSAGMDEIVVLTDTLLTTGGLREGERLLGKLESFLGRAAAQLTVAEWRKAVSTLIGKLEHRASGEETLLLVHEARLGAQELRISQVNDLLRKMFETILQGATGEPKAKSGKQLVDTIKAYIDSHYRTVSLEEIASTFYLNKNYFCSLFKGVTGESFMEYLTGRRMEQAKRLLAESELKTYEIADRVGYGDQRYFSQVFRKHAGCQPTQYRQRIRASEKP